MRRCVVNVATGSRYIRGQQRLIAAMRDISTVTWADQMPPESPTHDDVPYAFKSFALRYARESMGFDTLLWADSCILPVQDMEPLWQKIETEGVWIARNGWRNDEWCADSAYPDLFPQFATETGYDLEAARAHNATIPHVVATCFGLSMRHEVGRSILDEYLRLARDTRAFCGPWINANAPNAPSYGLPRCAPCGPPTVLGHRHDQTALSVLAHRFSVAITDCPEIFSYRGGETDKTILVADGAF